MPRPTRKKLKWTALAVVAATGISAWGTRHLWVKRVLDEMGIEPILTKTHIARAMNEALLSPELPAQLVVEAKGKSEKLSVEYTFDRELSAQMKGLLESYKPDYGAFVAIEPTTGRILALNSFNPGDPWTKDHMALRSTFPSASVFKVVTAAAAIAERKAHADMVVSFNGSRHTLYKSNVFKEGMNRWTTHTTLKEAFAQSINSVFGKMGVFMLGPSELNTYAARFGFNRKIDADIPIQQGQARITEDPWEIAEAASGFTKHNTMSPLQGALIAATIANDGKMMEPYAVERLAAADGRVRYQVQPQVSSVVIDPDSAREMRELMRETIRSGTSRGSFRGFLKSGYSMVDVGGKTGSLTGDDPKGRYDWFIGYGIDGNRKIAVAALTISKEYWKVKSAYLARKAIEAYFRDVAEASAPMAAKKKWTAQRKLASSRVGTRSKRRRH